MRTVELARVAAAAEALRLRQIVKRQGMRAVYGAIAGVFAIAVLVLLHVIAYQLLVQVVSPIIASVIVFVFDLVVAGVMGLLAMHNSPNAVEIEALAVRKQAVDQMKQSVTVMAIAGEVGTLVLRRRAQKAVAPRGRAWLLGELAGRLLARR